MAVMFFVLPMLASALAFSGPPALILCGKGGTVWNLGSIASAPDTIAVKADPTQCLTLQTAPLADGKKCDPNGKGCVTLGPCATATKWKVTATKTAGQSYITTDSGFCLDFEANIAAQEYKCVQSANQHWVVDAVAGTIGAGWIAGSFLGVEGSGCPVRPPPPPPPAPSPFCAKFHPIHDRNVYDPSGPIHAPDGTWHTWEDDGGWSHWTSKDLIHWSGDFQDSTHFGGDTGSVSPTGSGVYAFWPIMGGPGKGAIGSAVSTDTNGLTTWKQRGPTIPMPKRINTGYRDPVRAFEYNGKWYVGVGCGNREEGAQFCLFEADDDTLANFTDRGSLYTTNVTFGNVDGNIVWQPANVSANMMECPDLFPLGDKHVLVGSLYKTNQWWVGTLAEDPPRFTPERVGILDYGNGYAAKTGSEWVQNGTTRRLIFGFTGWSEPTMPSGCGRALIIPRELTVEGSELITRPIPETAVLRASDRFHTVEADAGGAVAKGSQVELRLNCTGVGTTGKVGVRTLQTADGKAYTEIGYDFDKQAFYADHSACCGKPNAVVQRAPLPASRLGVTFSVTAFVDGGLIEAFSGGKVITPLVAPDPTQGAPDDRISTITNSANPAVTCTLDSWVLKY